MNEQQSDQRAGAGSLRWFRRATLLLFLVAAFEFFAGLSWGAYNIPLLALFGVGLGLLSGILYIIFGIVVGVILGWMIAMVKFCTRWAWVS
jgi:hypothetical protein